MKSLKFAAALLVAVVAWQVEMAVVCAGRCIHRPRVAKVQQAPPASPSPQQCRGPQCPTPTPLPPPAARSSTR